MRPNGSRRTVLLTGASGVVGRALLPRLVAGGSDVVCLAHTAAVDGPALATLRGDVTRPRFGMSAPAWRRLASGVDAVVHAAAVTAFNGSDADLHRTNVDGTRHALELADAAGAPMHHVSSAYLHARGDAGRGRRAARYAASKRAAEALVRDSGVPYVISRPSIVVGDSTTGATSRFQGLHQVAEGIARGIVPIIPFDAGWPVDVVPQDVVADAVATLVEREQVGQEVWVTAGGRAPALATAVRVLLEVLAEAGAPAAAPRFIDPETFDRLVAPAFLDALPAATARTVTRLLDVFAVYLVRPEPMPSDLPALGRLGVAALPDPVTTLRRSLAFWALRSGVAPAARADEALTDDLADDLTGQEVA